MGKNDDFAARLATIKEQSNAPDPTGGMITDPRRHYRPALAPHSATLTRAALLVPCLALSGALAIAVAIYAFSPNDQTQFATSKAQTLVPTPDSHMKLGAGSRTPATPAALTESE